MRPMFTHTALVIALSIPMALTMSMAAAGTPTPQATAAADQPVTTPRGTTFILPEGWAREQRGNALVLTPPEADGSRLVIVDATASS
ncbi:MAG: hypothetical protein RLY77_1336, partial [Pseudomonadota bacterium]